MPDSHVQAGKVFLVGAGPGDPGLISVRGVECLQTADAILFDYLVNPRLLEYAGSNCELISLGSHAQGRVMPQEEICRHLIELAGEGKRVVRLKAGDPAIFARLAEELRALSDAKIQFEIVPGITSGFAAASIAGLPITDRDCSSAVALVTGHETPGKESSAIDFRALANFPGTLVIYMGTTTVERWSGQLMNAGMSPETPTLIIRRVTFPDQTTIPCTLGEVAARINVPEKIRPPVVFVVGEVANPANLKTWFERRPLFGRTIMLCRPHDQSLAVRNLFEELGAEVVIHPAIEIGPPPGWEPVDDAIKRLSNFDWIVFSSTNGVDHFFGRLFELGFDSRALGGVKIAAVGNSTAERLKDRGFNADLTPQEYRAESLADALCEGAKGKRFLLVRASRGREVLLDQLTASGGIVEQIAVYQSSDVKDANPEVAQRLRRGEIDWFVASSSAIATSTCVMFGESLGKAKVASISPITSETLRKLGHEPTCEATTYSFEGIRDAIVRWEAEANQPNRESH